MRRFGNIAGIVWNRRTGFLVAGHQRVNVLMEKGATLELEPEPHITDPETGESWPVRVVDWDETVADAAMVEANNPHIAGEFTDGLAGILSRLEDEDPLMVDDVGLNRLFCDLEREADETPSDKPQDESEKENPIYPLVARLNESYNYVVIFTENDLDWTRLKSILAITKCRTNKSKTVGEGRAISFQVFKSALGLE
ncbi:hypothetical protein LLG95_05430 [bacterium]|nr:hypothetical protein [bacterium]